MAEEKKPEDHVSMIAEGVASLLTEQKLPLSEKIKIGLQAANFLTVGIVGIVLSFYANGIKEQQEKQNTQSVQAKVILDFMGPLLDASDRKKPQIALHAIETFINPKFSNEIAIIVNSEAGNERLDQLQSKPVTVDGADPASAGSAKGRGWIYLGSWRADTGNPVWETRYFNFPRDKSPADIGREKPELKVLDSVLGANLRSEAPTNGHWLDGKTVIGRVKVGDVAKVLEVEPVPNTRFYWAKVEVK